MRKLMLAAPVMVGMLAGAAVGALAQDLAGPDGLVTEQVERGVERIVRDAAGHDLDEKHPDHRYDMDSVFVAPDGTIWLTSSYSDSDNDAHPPGALVWALGESGTPQYSAARVFCVPDDPGVLCFDRATETGTTYLENTRIHAVAPAPDGTFWAVGDRRDVDGNGGLYHISIE